MWLGVTLGMREPATATREFYLGEESVGGRDWWTLPVSVGRTGVGVLHGSLRATLRAWMKGWICVLLPPPPSSACTFPS